MKKTRVITLMLVALLVLTSTAFAIEPQLPIYDELTEFTIMVRKDSRSLNTYNDKQCAIDAEKATNIHVNYIEVPSDAWVEKTNLTFASGEIPDAIIGGDINLVQNIGMTARLNDYISAETTPNIQAIFEKYPDLPGALTLDDGYIHSLPYGNVGVRTNLIDAQLWINTEWLKKLELDMPTTVDEFYDVLVAFRDNDPNGNGKADEIPLLANEVSTTYSIMNMLGFFGTLDDTRLGAEHIRIENGTAIFTPAEDRYYEALCWLHKLYSEGLIWKDVFTADYNDYLAKGSSEECIVGCVIDWYKDCVITTDAVNNFELMMPVKADDDTEVLWNMSYFGRSLDMFVITTACRDPEALVRWYDYINSDMTIQLTWFQSPENVLWRYNDAGEWTTFTDNVPADTTSTIMRRNVAVGPTVPVYFLSDMQSLSGRYADKAAAVEAYSVYIPKEYLTDGFSHADEEESRNMIRVTLDNYLGQFVANAIVNGITEEDWQKHLNTLTTIGADEYTELWQSFYNAHKAA